MVPIYALDSVGIWEKSISRQVWPIGKKLQSLTVCLDLGNCWFLWRTTSEEHVQRTFFDDEFGNTLVVDFLSRSYRAIT